MRDRIQLRIDSIVIECIPVSDRLEGYENHLRYRYKAFGAFLEF